MEVGNQIRETEKPGLGSWGLGSGKSRSDAAFGRRRLESQSGSAWPVSASGRGQSPSVASSASRAKNHL
jgi:hypothetical protein